MRAILFLARAEVLHIVRDRATLVQILVIPIVQLLVLSNAATFDVRDTPMLRRGLRSDERVARAGDALAAGRQFRRRSSASASLAGRTRRCCDGEATLVLTIPHDFEATWSRDGHAPVQLVVNAEKGSTAGHRAVVRRARSSRRYARGARRASAAHRAAGRRVAAARRRSRSGPALVQPDLNYRHYMVPGILVALVT